MAQESFEDPETAELLNRYFVSVKVDKEERPDIDSIYMSVCQALSGSGGWPVSVFMTADQKPFFAGTYFPKHSRYGIASFCDLLNAIKDKWLSDRENIKNSAEEITLLLKKEPPAAGSAEKDLAGKALSAFKRSFDEKYAGFGNAPKFPAAHNLMFLMEHYEKSGDEKALKMAEMTLTQLYCGGIFDHIGYGFSRYSTDRFFLVPHFEKMLYDNALLISAYSRAYKITGKTFYREAAEKTAAYILREMTAPDGGFYSAQDADSEGEEGGYYLFTPEEIKRLFDEETGTAVCRYFDITEKGNFEGKNIPNLLKTPVLHNSFDKFLPRIYEYRKARRTLHLDDKVISSWNALIISAMCALFRVTGDINYLECAKKAFSFLETNLYDEKGMYVSFREGKRSEKGFLDDYAFTCLAALDIYGSVFEDKYLIFAQKLADKAITDFYDTQNGGFYLYGKESEELILRPKDTYDGALPSGNSAMAKALVRLYYLTDKKEYKDISDKQLAFMSGAAASYPAGFCFFLSALYDNTEPEIITAVIKDKEDLRALSQKTSLSSVVKILRSPTEDYKLLNDKTTFYICKSHTCLPAQNTI